MTRGSADDALRSDVARGRSPLRLVCLLMLVAAFGHFNRISISVAGAERLISPDGIGATQMGMVYSAFLLCYTLAMLPGGWLIDRYGARAALAVLCAGSTVCVALTGATGWLQANPTLLWGALLVVRSVMGALNAPLHPGSAHLVTHSVPWPQVSFANGMVTFAACLGMAATYFLFGELIDYLDWPGAFWASSGLTFLVLLVWLWGSRQGAIGPSAPAPAPASAGIRWHRGLICLTLSYAALGYFQYLFFYWMEYYFKDVLDLGTERSRLYSTLVVLANGVGMVLGGWLTDRAARWAGRTGHALIPIAGFVGSAVVLIAGLMASSAEVTLGCFIAAMAALGMCEGPSWTMAVLVGGRRGGTTAALMNTGGNAGGLLAPVITPQLSHYFGWQVGMGLASLVALGGAALWLVIARGDHFAPSTGEAKEG